MRSSEKGVLSAVPGAAGGRLRFKEKRNKILSPCFAGRSFVLRLWFRELRFAGTYAPVSRMKDLVISYSGCCGLASSSLHKRLMRACCRISEELSLGFYPGESRSSGSEELSVVRKGQKTSAVVIMKTGMRTQEKGGHTYESAMEQWQ